MKGTCTKCGQRLSLSTEEHTSGKVVLCPECGLPVRVGIETRKHRINKLMLASFILLAIVAVITASYALRWFSSPEINRYKPGTNGQIVYVSALGLAFIGGTLSLVTTVHSVVDRPWSLLALVFHVGFILFWSVICWSF